jgi:sarcosine oxidase subunit alpha
VFATGAHDGVAAFPGNDLPGVLSARALAGLVRAGVMPDGPVAIAGGGFWADELARALGDASVLRVDVADVVEVAGTGGVRTITVRSAGVSTTHPVAVVALALQGAPAFELPLQAGAETRFDPTRGYVVVTDPDGRIGPAAWAVGECTGAAFDIEALEASGERVAAAVASALG